MDAKDEGKAPGLVMGQEERRMEEITKGLEMLGTEEVSQAAELRS